MIPEHSTRSDVFDWESHFSEGGKPEYAEKDFQVRLRSTETQPTYDRRGGRRKCRIQRQHDLTEVNTEYLTLEDIIHLCFIYKGNKLLEKKIKESEKKQVQVCVSFVVLVYMVLIIQRPCFQTFPWF